MRDYTIGLYEKSMPAYLSWTEKLTFAKKAGFDFVEISIDETEEKLARLDYSKQQRFQIMQAVYDTEIPIKTMCLSGHRKYPLGSSEPHIAQKSLSIMEKAIDFACDMGIRIIQLAGYDVYYEFSTEQTRDLFLVNLKKCVDMAAQNGVILAFETMELEFMNTVNKAMKYVNKVNSPYLGLYPDAGNLTNAAVLYGEDPLEDIISGKGHIFAMHLKETVPGKFREIPFGQGHVNFVDIVRTSYEIGVRIYVAEFWSVENRNWLLDIKNAEIFMKNVFNKALSGN